MDNGTRKPYLTLRDGHLTHVVMGVDRDGKFLFLDVEGAARITDEAEARSIYPHLPVALRDRPHAVSQGLYSQMARELDVYLDALTITSDNIGDIRRACFVPWDSKWNGIVRDATAAREV